MAYIGGMIYMNMIKKLLGSAVSVMCGVCICLPISVIAVDSARTYDPCDVNQDGSVDIMDVIRLDRYLTGEVSILPTSISVLDAYADKVVNAADSMYVFYAAIGTTSTFNSSYIDITSQYNYNIYTGSKNEENFDFNWMDEWHLTPEEINANDNAQKDTPASDSVSYYRCVYSPASLSTYTLSNASSATSTESIPLDRNYVNEIIERTTNPVTQVNGAGLDGVVRLHCDSNNLFASSERGTGFIVSDHVIACAAHSVFIDSTHNHNQITVNNFAPNLKITLYNTDGTPRTTSPIELTIKEVHIPYDLIPSYSTANDYALITVSQSLSAYTHFNLETPVLQETPALTSIPTYLLGFPGTTSVRMSMGNIAESGSTDYVLHKTCPSTGGFSGGPVFSVYNYTAINNNVVTTVKVFSAVSIHTGPGVGPIFNYKLIRFYNDNSNIGY